MMMAKPVTYKKTWSATIRPNYISTLTAPVNSSCVFAVVRRRAAFTVTEWFARDPNRELFSSRLGPALAFKMTVTVFRTLLVPIETRTVLFFALEKASPFNRAIVISCLMASFSDAVFLNTAHNGHFHLFL